MQQLQKRHASEIRTGDRIQHAGSPKQVTWVEQKNLGRTWRFDVTDEATGSVNWVHYDNAGSYSTVLRYEDAHVDPRIAELEALAREEGIELPMSPNLIISLEDSGKIVDLLSGQVYTAVTIAVSPHFIFPKEEIPK
jgi:hypothetical protein